MGPDGRAEAGICWSWVLSRRQSARRHGNVVLTPLPAGQVGTGGALATREALQNASDAIKAAVRARKTRTGTGRFEVTWDAERRALTWADNGIGMDTTTILEKFLSLGESGKSDASSSEEAAGGFGVAKAVILGTSTSLSWELHSRDNLAVSKGSDRGLTLPSSPPEWPGLAWNVRGHLPWLRGLLWCNLPGWSRHP